MPFQSEKQRRWMWKNKPDMAKKWTDEHGSTPVKASFGSMLRGLAGSVFRKRGTARADSSQAKIMGDPDDRLLDYFKTKYGRSAQPIQAKKGKYQKFEHPQHNITPIEHMEEKVSSKERIERLLDERKRKKESKQKLVRAQEGQLIREKTRGTGAAVKGTDHYVMQGMDAAQEGKLIQVPTRGTGQAVKGTDHYVMQGMDAAKDGKMIKAKHSVLVEDRTTKWDRLHNEPDKRISGQGKRKRMGKKPTRGTGPKRISKEWLEWKYGEFNKGGPIKAKTGFLTTDLKGYDVKKISKKTSEKLFDLYKHRERGGFKKAKDYKKYLTSLGKMQKAPLSGTSTTLPPKTARLLSNLQFVYKDKSTKARALSVLKKIGKRTGIGRVVMAGAIAAGAYEAGKKNLFKLKDKKRVDKKKPTKKSIGGETVVMKSGGGYIDDLI